MIQSQNKEPSCQYVESRQSLVFIRFLNRSLMQGLMIIKLVVWKTNQALLLKHQYWSGLSDICHILISSLKILHNIGRKWLTRATQVILVAP